MAPSLQSRASESPAEWHSSWTICNYCITQPPVGGDMHSLGLSVVGTAILSLAAYMIGSLLTTRSNLHQLGLSAAAHPRLWRQRGLNATLWISQSNASVQRHIDSIPVPSAPRGPPGAPPASVASLHDGGRWHAQQTASERHDDAEGNMLHARNSGFESAGGKTDWDGYCGRPRVTCTVAHRGNCSLEMPVSRRAQIFCGPKLAVPPAVECGAEYRLTLWATTDARWVRKSKPENRIGHHSHLLLTIKANGVGGTCGFKADEYLWVCAQSVNLVRGGRWVKLDGLFQFGYGPAGNATSQRPPATPHKKIGHGPAFHVEGIDPVERERARARERERGGGRVRERERELY